MKIKLNKQVKIIAEPCSVQQLLDETLPLAQKGIAVAINSQIIAKNNWQTHSIQPDDDVLILRATQGG